MDRSNRYFFLGGAAALGFYLLLIALLLVFFNDYRHSKRYVPKNTPSIEVSLTSAPPVRQKPKPVAQKERKKRVEAKKPAVAKKAAPSAVKPKKATPRPKAIASLFEGIKVAEPTDSRPARLANAPKIRYKPSAKKHEEEQKRAEALVRDINLSKTSIKMASQSGGQGDVDAYMSKLYDILYGSWQPEAVYAGSTATVRLFIEPDGSFNYRILYPSDNQGFNESLIEYLDMLQKRGLPPHERKKTLTIDVEFKAKE